MSRTLNKQALLFSTNNKYNIVLKIYKFSIHFIANIIQKVTSLYF